MKKLVIISCAIFIVSGCCQNKQAILQYATTIHEQAQTGLELLKRCKADEKPACDGVEQNLKALDTSAQNIQKRIQ